MEKKELVALGIRISALFFIIYIIRDGSAYIFTLSTFQDENNWTFIAFGTLVFFLLLGIFVVKFPLLITGMLLPKVEQVNQNIKYNLKDIEEVAFTILGLFVLVTAIPEIFYWLIVMQQYTNESSALELRHQDIGNVVSTIIELIIGFWLLFGARGLRGLLYKFRYAGLEK